MTSTPRVMTTEASHFFSDFVFFGEMTVPAEEMGG